MLKKDIYISLAHSKISYFAFAPNKIFVLFFEKNARNTIYAENSADPCATPEFFSNFGLTAKIRLM